MASAPHTSPPAHPQQQQQRPKKSRLAVLRKKTATKSPKRTKLGLGVHQSPQPLSLNDATHSAPTSRCNLSSFGGTRTTVIRSQSHQKVSGMSGTQIAINSILLDNNSIMPRKPNHLPQLIHQHQQHHQQQPPPTTTSIHAHSCCHSTSITAANDLSHLNDYDDANIKRLVTPSPPYCSDGEASASSAESDDTAKEREIRRKCDELTHSHPSNNSHQQKQNEASVNRNSPPSMRRPRSMSAVAEIEKQQQQQQQSPTHSPAIGSGSDPRLQTSTGNRPSTRHLFRRPSTEIIPTSTQASQQSSSRINVHVTHSRAMDSAEISPSSSVGTNPSLSVQSHPLLNQARARHVVLFRKHAMHYLSLLTPMD